MLEKPDIEEENIVACLQNEYGLHITKIEFLPLGADLNTAVYHLTTSEPHHYFLKLRSGQFAEASVTIPKYLYDCGLNQIIPPLPTRNGQLWTSLPPYKLILYTFVTGQNAFQVNLTDQQRIELGAALKRFHTTHVPASLTADVPQETFSPRWRETVKSFLAGLAQTTYTDPVAVALASFLQSKHAETAALVDRAEQLARTLQAQTPEFILCHGDIHGWNLLIDQDSRLHMVDWDTLILAPKERDLMFVGSGLSGNGHTLQEEVELFYQGYGQTQISHTAIAYYRYDRIIEDIAVYCEQIFLSNEGGKDRIEAVNLVKTNFYPNGTIAIAYQSELVNRHYKEAKNPQD